ncbi:DUF3299 domain-containing protein [Planctobacterium marinum]|uniref:DUF3299 domain-containing protein n=1 Tax=Planctobacterium marinum TaxID=1631968 RepID=A0AA48KR07_9ALTE|nr:hypothetical protein MACH26_25440 [Planctobacterium marinum]
MPEDDLQALLNPPESLFEIEDGSAQDSFDDFNQQNFEDEQSQRFQAALNSARVVKEMAEQQIRIPGFLVPLEAINEDAVIEFFIVPYFGACLHLPPPPPNQIIYAKSEKGVKLQSLNQPFWFSGTLKIEIQGNAMGTSAYLLHGIEVVPYED